MKKHIVLISSVILICAFFLSLLIGSVVITPKELIASIFSENSISRYIFFYSRLPRTIACIAAGAALAVSGAILQSVLANNLAAPGIIGVNSGAGLAVTLSCAIGVTSGFMMSNQRFGQPATGGQQKDKGGNYDDKKKQSSKNKGSGFQGATGFKNSFKKFGSRQ